MGTSNDFRLIREIDFELSSICNANCPVCPRTEDGYLSDFEQTYWDLNEVKRVLDIGILKNLTGFNICGNYGDPMGNPDIVNIVKWVRSHNDKCKIHIRTNGGIGSIIQYEELGKLNVLITFGIDGIGEKNNLYRVGVNWKKLNDNITAYGKYSQPANLRLQFLLWNETVDQIIPIINYAKSLNVGSLHLRRPFKRGDDTVVYNKKGKPKHYLTILNHPLSESIMDTEWELKNFDSLIEKVSSLNIPTTKLVIPKNFIRPSKKISKKEYKHIDFEFSEDEKHNSSVLECISKNVCDPKDLKNSAFNIFITYDKLLLPCCYFPPMLKQSTFRTLGNEYNYEKEVLNKIEKIGLEEFSLKNKTIKDIFKNEVLQKFFYNNMEKNESFVFCKISCGKCDPSKFWTNPKITNKIL